MNATQNKPAPLTNIMLESRVWFAHESHSFGYCDDEQLVRLVAEALFGAVNTSARSQRANGLGFARLIAGFIRDLSVRERALTLCLLSECLLSKGMV